MSNLVRNIFKYSGNYLKSSYRLVHNEVSKHQVDTQVQVEEADAPITLEENPFKKERKVCILCRLKIEPDYKNVRLLSQFQSSYTGRIYGKHITGLCKAKQEKVEREILKAQNCGFMPVYNKVPEYLHDPRLFDPDHPFRPHKF
ncbi:28S ribosomal protein S18c, mitochondrial [Fopius arisanus]|uniref:28S ribosomal protein S18c, mitochondrial n=1 Tax=Fopius arisanus TaxID=64838 RepID=A0A9R1T2A6_9HYME|nr:PREDICTED: 28S ribosomal protein S18c, mitochondrial [Fopius arisanus]